LSIHNWLAYVSCQNCDTHTSVVEGRDRLLSIIFIIGTQTAHQSMRQERRISIALAVTAMTTLMLELQLLRVFDAILQQNLAYVVITGAMFAFGLSGVYVALRPSSLTTDVNRSLAKFAAAFAASTLLVLPIVNLLPFDYARLGSAPISQAVYFSLLYLTLIVPFFLSGLIFATVFSSYASNIRSLYFFDLTGAAIGCVAFIPLLPRIGPGGLLVVCAGLSLVAAVLFRSDGRRSAAATLGIAALLMAAPFLKTDGYIDFSEKTNKSGSAISVKQARAAGDVEVTRWDPIAKIDVIKAYETNRETGGKSIRNRVLAYDGGAQTSRYFPFDGDYAALRQSLERDLSDVTRHFWNRSVVVAHWLKADTDADVLIIGSAGGQETKAALLFNPKRVDAVEMVRAVVDLGRGDYSEYIGNIFRDPRVNLQVGEGRHFLRSSGRSYDVIQILSNHTTSSMAAGTGASSPVFLQTVEAYVDYFSTLRDDGILQVNHHIYPRVIATAAAAWTEMGRKEFRRHVVVYERRPWDNIPLILFKMSPWTAEEMAKLDAFMLRRTDSVRDRYFLVEHPLKPDQSFLSNEFYSGNLSDETAEIVPYRVKPATDDQPYFNFLRKHFGPIEADPAVYLNSSTAFRLNSQLNVALGIPMDVLHWFVSGGIAIFFAVVCILVPLYFTDAGRARWPGEFASLLYFSCLGAGFIVVELTLIQVFTKFVGYPLYTYSVVLFTMLMAAGLGSLAAQAMGVTPRDRWSVPFVGIFVTGCLLWLISPWIFERFQATDLVTRIAITVGSIFPMAFFMGFAFPLGILAIKNRPTGAVAWAWGVNGLFTTIGGLGASLSMILVGFKATLAIGLSMYLLATVAFVRLRACMPGHAHASAGVTCPPISVPAEG